jgi:hypothetical protein
MAAGTVYNIIRAIYDKGCESNCGSTNRFIAYARGSPRRSLGGIFTA